MELLQNLERCQPLVVGGRELGTLLEIREQHNCTVQSEN